MGLFDSLFSDNPNDAAYLALASGLLGGKGSFNSILGNSLAGAQGAYSGAADRGLKNQMTKMQIEEVARKLKAQQQAEADQESFRETLAKQGSPLMQASQAALAGGGGPTLSNAANMPRVDPTQSLMFEAMKSRQMSPLDYVKLTQKDTAPIKLGPDERLLQPGTFKELASNPRHEKATTDFANYQEAVKGGFTGTFLDYQLALKKAGASSVSVNTGEKGLKNELAIKQDFKTEPIYKDYSEMVSAYKQIKAGINQATPIGDLTTATKIMKLLDPTSVVRESELGMAMAATGRMDRLKNFVELQVKGQKLTPQQRQEFGTLADELYDAAGQAYNQKRSEYENIANRYELNTEGLGPKHKPVMKAKSVRAQADAILNGE
jgi:hypothetical protein